VLGLVFSIHSLHFIAVRSGLRTSPELQRLNRVFGGWDRRSGHLPAVSFTGQRMALRQPFFFFQKGEKKKNPLYRGVVFAQGQASLLSSLDLERISITSVFLRLGVLVQLAKLCSERQQSAFWSSADARVRQTIKL